MSEVAEDARGYGIDLSGPIIWFDCSGGPEIESKRRFSLNDLTGISVSLKKVVLDNSARRIRVVLDITSPLLLLNPLETIYRFLGSLLADLKRSDVVLLATMESGMHAARDFTALEQLFDGVIEMMFYEEAGPGTPLSVLRVKKMRGLPPPRRGNFMFSYTAKGSMEIKPFPQAERVLVSATP